MTEFAMPKFVEKTCEMCRDTFRTAHDGELCPPCEHATKMALECASVMERLSANREQMLRAALSSAGLSARELTAEVAKVPAAIKSAMLTVAKGKGFGLSGGAGCGKMFAMVCVVRTMIEQRWVARVPSEGKRAMRPFMAWARWPETVNEFRVTAAVREAGLAEIAATVDRLSEVEVLVIDDLGAERLKGDYAEDWATSQLDLIVDRRYNDMKPTMYTTNLARRELMERYGSRLFSRLVGENPLFEVRAIPDMRVVNGKGGA